jgi:hypothetical protein
VAPDILNAIVQANDGFAAAYGDDDWTRSVERRFSELFGRSGGISGADRNCSERYLREPAGRYAEVT